MLAKNGKLIEVWFSSYPNQVRDTFNVLFLETIILYLAYTRDVHVWISVNQANHDVSAWWLVTGDNRDIHYLKVIWIEQLAARPALVSATEQSNWKIGSSLWEENDHI
jgi:hypothetical protein